MRLRFPYCKHRSIKEYFSAPLCEREKWGFYLKPLFLPQSHFKDLCSENVPLEGWELFYAKIRKCYPVQWFIREWLLSLDNPAWFFFWVRQRRLQEFRWKVKLFFKPCSPRFRKFWPRHEYRDLVEVIREANFALILDFWFEEFEGYSYDDSVEDSSKEFEKWMRESVAWITVGRKNVEQEFYETCIKDFQTAKKIREKRRKRDEEILVQMMKYRQFFWT